MLALRDALPERITAPWGRRLSYRMTGKDPRNGRGFHDIFFLTYEGGRRRRMGSTATTSRVSWAGGNVLAQDYETFEVQNPVHLIEHEYVTDSAGPGRWRGGLGTRTRVRLLRRGDRRFHPRRRHHGAVARSVRRRRRYPQSSGVRVPRRRPPQRPRHGDHPRHSAGHGLGSRWRRWRGLRTAGRIATSSGSTRICVTGSFPHKPPRTSTARC